MEVVIATEYEAQYDINTLDEKFFAVAELHTDRFGNIVERRVRYGNEELRPCVCLVLDASNLCNDKTKRMPLPVAVEDVEGE
jgi:hypothetical protein